MTRSARLLPALGNPLSSLPWLAFLALSLASVATPVLAEDQPAAAAQDSAQAAPAANEGLPAEGAGARLDAVAEGEEVQWEAPQSRTAFFTTVTIDDDEHVTGDIVAIGGTAIVRGHVTGDIVVVGGRLELAGTVDGEVVAVASDTVLRSTATIGRDFVNVFGPLEDEGATFDMQRIVMTLPFPVPTGIGPFSFLAGLIAWINAAQMAVLFLILLLVALIVPQRLEVMAHDTPRSYGFAMLIGALAHLAIVVVNVLLAITLIGIPLVVLLDLAFRVLRIAGRGSLFVTVGRWLGRRFDRELSPLGALSLGFLVYALLNVVPFLFGIWGLAVGILFATLFKVAIDWPAIGLVLVTGVGRHPRGLPATPPPLAPTPE